mmetsp:Transcript_236/g.418  ORF Transcript_236/g.418 Transcript_236/m.418 type:complete len:375 (+) Transcript_236:31-1155(+)
MADCSFNFLRIPTVDISAFLSSAGAEAAASKDAALKEMVEAVTTYGSFWVKLPDYSCKERDAYLESISRLFKVDSSKRPFHSGNGVARGYIQVGGESGAASNFEHKEGFSYGFGQWDDRGQAPSNDMEAYNTWPSCGDAPEFSKDDRTMLEKKLWGVCTDVGDALVRMFSVDLCGDEGTLADDWRGGETTHLARLFRYLPLSKLPEGFDKDRYSQVLGSSAHTDWGLLTIILADDTPGLELYWTGQRVSASKESEEENADAGWRLVLPEFDQGKLFVNAGDFMAIASGGRYTSPLHRVVLPTDVVSQERRSCVFFYYPRYDAKIPTLTGGCKQTYSVFTDQANGGGALSVNGEDISFGSFISQKWASVARRPSS